MMKTSYRKLKRWIAISGLLLMLPCLVDAQTITYEWYRGSTKVGSGLSFTDNSKPAAGTYTYYRKAIYNGQSLQTTPFTVTVNALPEAPTSVTGGSVCASGAVILSAMPPWGCIVKWYSASSSGAALSSSTSYTTPTLTATTTYYVESVNSTTGCASSSRTAVTATVLTKALVSAGTISGPSTACSGTPFAFTSTPGELDCSISFGGLKWTAEDACTDCTWQGAKDKCASLGMRLPNDGDWGGLPKTPNVLGLTDDNGYWSATDYDSNVASKWNWNTSDGLLYGPYNKYKDEHYRVRCVTEPTISIGGIDWTISDIGGLYTYPQAVAECAKLGMRLPDENAWASLRSYDDCARLNLDMKFGYWSSKQTSSSTFVVYTWYNGSFPLTTKGMNLSSQNGIRCVK